LLNKWLRILQEFSKRCAAGNGMDAIICMKLGVLCDIEADAGNILTKLLLDKAAKQIDRIRLNFVFRHDFLFK
jgi:hypothetical protein